MEASMVANTWADAAIIENSVQVKFMDSGYHYDMTEATKADGINLQSDWELMGLEVWEGKVLCMPFDNDPRGIYYNKTAFKEALNKGLAEAMEDGTWKKLYQSPRAGGVRIGGCRLPRRHDPGGHLDSNAGDSGDTDGHHSCPESRYPQH